MPWRRWMLVMLRQLGLDKYIANENVPGVAKKRQRIVAQRKWSKRDARPDSEMLRFSDGTAEMIHIRVGVSGGMIAREMWELLTIKGR